MSRQIRGRAAGRGWGAPCSPLNLLTSLHGWVLTIASSSTTQMVELTCHVGTLFFNIIMLHSFVPEAGGRSSRWARLCSKGPQTGRNTGHRREALGFWGPKPGATHVLTGKLMPFPVTLETIFCHLFINLKPVRDGKALRGPMCSPERTRSLLRDTASQKSREDSNPSLLAS